MNNLGIYGLSLVGCLILYKGYYYGRSKIEEYVVKRVMEELDKRMKEEEEQEHFKPVHLNSAVIKVNSGGKSHSVYVPYDRKKSTPMLRKKVYLIKGEEKIDISQKPGIPYIVSAQDLGGESIIVENLDGQVVFKFEKDQIPNCF